MTCFTLSAILEDVADVLQPFKIATEYLSGEKYPTISALAPVLAEFELKLNSPQMTHQLFVKLRRYLLLIHVCTLDIRTGR